MKTTFTADEIETAVDRFNEFIHYLKNDMEIIYMDEDEQQRFIETVNDILTTDERIKSNV